MTLNTKLFQISTVQVRNVSYWKMRNWYASLVKPRPQSPPYRHIIQIGDPTLRTKCEEILPNEIKSPHTQSLIQHMKYVMKKYDCVGLSAPQIGIPFKLFVMEFNAKHAKIFTTGEFKSKEMSLVPFTVVFNPEMKTTDYTKIVFTESCESVKGFYADVPRHRAIELKGYNENGEAVVIKANGWTARIIQHELDHLNGKLYTDVMDRTSLTCTCWEAVNERKGNVILPYGPNL